MRSLRRSAPSRYRDGGRGVDIPVRFEMLESRCMFSATAFRQGDVGWFVDPAKPQLDRYDITTEQWLAPVVLEGAQQPATAALVDDDGIYAAFGRAIYRYRSDGTAPTWLFAAQNDVRALHTDGKLLFVIDSVSLYGRATSVDKSTNSIVDFKEVYVDSFGGTSIAPQVNKIFGRSEGISPSDITSLGYDDAGRFTTSGDSPYHGDYPGASKTFVTPDGSRVVDDSGTSYSTTDLTWIGSLGTVITDLDFVGNGGLVAVSGRTLSAFSPAASGPAFLLSGTAQIGFDATTVFVGKSDVVAFVADASQPSGWRTQIVPLSVLAPPQPGALVDPVGLAYTPNAVAHAADGTVLLFSASQQSLFRWVPATQHYTATIPLLGTPSYFAYSSVLDAAFVAYPNGQINRIDLQAEAPVEKPFFILPGVCGGLAAAGRYLFAEDGSGAWATHYTIDGDGRLVDSRDWNYFSTEYIWSEARQSMYFFRDDTSPNDLLREPINADGTVAGLKPGEIGFPVDSPLHDSTGFSHPIRVKPDGSVVVLGSGAVHNATTLARLPYSVPTTFVDAGWIRNSLYTLAAVDGGSRVGRYRGAQFEPLGNVDLVGAPGALLPLDMPGGGPSGANGRMLAITSVAGVPTFTVLRPDLSVQKPLVDSDVDGDGRSDVLLRDSVSGAVTAAIRDASGTVVATRPLGGSPDWEVVVAADFGGDGIADVLWRHVPSGATVMWQMSAGGAVVKQALIGGDSRWRVAAAGDYDGDGREDLLWQDVGSGSMVVWLMNNFSVRSSGAIAERVNGPVRPSDGNWRILPVANGYDANGDGLSDLLWQHRTSGVTVLWHMNGTRAPSQAFIGGDATWKVVGAADVDGDGRGDLLWRHEPSGGVVIWLMADTRYRASQGVDESLMSSFVVAYDVNGDGMADTGWADRQTGASSLRLGRGFASLGSWGGSPSSKWVIVRRPTAKET